MTPPTTLPRVLGPWMAMAIVVGTVIGTGVFKKAYKVSGNVPEFGLAISVWVVVGGLTLLGSFALAEIALRHPRSGGNYVFLRAAYGRATAFLWGWVDFWIVRSASIAVLATMFTESLHNILQEAGGPAADALGFWPRQFVTVGLIAAVAAVNARGTLLGGKVQLFLTVLKVGSVIGIASLPLVVPLVSPGTEPRPTTAHMRPAWPADWSQVSWGGYAAAVVAVLWAYNGWMNIGNVAGEVTNPARNVPLALLGGLVLLIALYVSANVAYYTVIPQAEMATMESVPVSTHFTARLLGPAAGMLASLVLMTSALGALNGNVLVGPRLLSAMAAEGQAPAWLAQIDPKTQTPKAAIYALAAWSALLVLILGVLLITTTLFHTNNFTPDGRRVVKVPFDVLTDFVIFGATVFETLTIAALYVFRARDREQTAALPYRCWGYPIGPALYIGFMAWVMANMFAGEESRTEALIGLVFIAAGVAVYYGFVRGKSEPEASATTRQEGRR